MFPDSQYARSIGVAVQLHPRSHGSPGPVVGYGGVGVQEGVVGQSGRGAPGSTVPARSANLQAVADLVHPEQQHGAILGEGEGRTGVGIVHCQGSGAVERLATIARSQLPGPAVGLQRVGHRLSARAGDHVLVFRLVALCPHQELRFAPGMEANGQAAQQVGIGRQVELAARLAADAALNVGDVFSARGQSALDGGIQPQDEGAPRQLAAGLLVDTQRSVGPGADLGLGIEERQPGSEGDAGCVDVALAAQAALQFDQPQLLVGAHRTGGPHRGLDRGRSLDLTLKFATAFVGEGACLTLERGVAEYRREIGAVAVDQKGAIAIARLTSGITLKIVQDSRTALKTCTIRRTRLYYVQSVTSEVSDPTNLRTRKSYGRWAVGCGGKRPRLPCSERRRSAVLSARRLVSGVPCFRLGEREPVDLDLNT